jgi:hypothetical protein
MFAYCSKMPNGDRDVESPIEPDPAAAEIRRSFPRSQGGKDALRQERRRASSL